MFLAPHTQNRSQIAEENSAADRRDVPCCAWNLKFYRRYENSSYLVSIMNQVNTGHILGTRYVGPFSYYPVIRKVI